MNYFYALIMSSILTIKNCNGRLPLAVLLMKTGMFNESAPDANIIRVCMKFLNDHPEAAEQSKTVYRVCLQDQRDLVERMLREGTQQYKNISLPTLIEEFRGSAALMKILELEFFPDRQSYVEALNLAYKYDIMLMKMLHDDNPSIPYGFDETKPWPTCAGKIDPSTVL